MKFPQLLLALTLLPMTSSIVRADDETRNLGAQSSKEACIAAVNQAVGTYDDGAPSGWHVKANGSQSGVIGLLAGMSVVVRGKEITVAEVVFENGLCTTRNFSR